MGRCDRRALAAEECESRLSIAKVAEAEGAR